MLDSRQKIIRIAIVAIVAIFIGVIIFAVTQSITRVGKIGVDITVYPEDAVVYLDGKYSPGSTIFATPGQHTFVARKDGFKDARIIVNVDNETKEITLLPIPESAAATKWAADPKIQARIEELGGVAANERGLALRDRYPIMDDLPYTSIAGPFRIDYGFTGTDDSKIFVLIGNSTPSGRVNALQWIRDQGYDPTTLDIRYEDYTNPLTKETN